MTVVIVFLLSMSLQASTIRDDQPDSDYLALGSSSEYASVGVFANSWNYTGCGILIASDWVLTAAHLFVAASSGSFTLNGTTYQSSQLISHPNWNLNDVLAGYDIGLVHLSTPVIGVTPIPIYDGMAEYGALGTFVGYGMTGTGLTGQTILDYQKRAFQNVIDGDFGNPDVLLSSDFDSPHTTAENQSGDPTPLPLEGAAGNGDSGGGVFITVDEQTYLAGIISVVVGTDGSGNGDYGDMTAFGRVSAFNSWINSYVSTAVPEPSPIALAGLGGLLLLAFRRIRREPLLRSDHAAAKY